MPSWVSELGRWARQMGHTMIGVGERWEAIHDLDLWVLRHFLSLELTTGSDAGRDMLKIRSFVEGWEWIGPGVWRGVELAEFVERDATVASAFVDVFEKVQSRIEGFGKEVPLEYLRVNVGHSDIQFSTGYRVDLVVNAALKIVRILKAQKAAQPGATDNPGNAQ